MPGEVKLTVCFSYLTASLTLIFVNVVWVHCNLNQMTRAALFPALTSSSSSLFFHARNTNIWSAICAAVKWSFHSGGTSFSHYSCPQICSGCRMKTVHPLSEVLPHMPLRVQMFAGTLRDFINLLPGPGYVRWAFFFLSISVCFWFTGPEVSSQAAPLSANKASVTLPEPFGFKQIRRLPSFLVKGALRSTVHIYVFPRSSIH